MSRSVICQVRARARASPSPRDIFACDFRLHSSYHSEWAVGEAANTKPQPCPHVGVARSYSDPALHRVIHKL